MAVNLRIPRSRTKRKFSAVFRDETGRAIGLKSSDSIKELTTYAKANSNAAARVDVVNRKTGIVYPVVQNNARIGNRYIRR